MPIDWFTVVAQILNFIVLIWILKRFLYKPVLKTMAERQERVRRSITDAAEEKRLAASEREQLAEERSQVEQQRDAEFQKIQTEARLERSRLIDEARQEFESSRARWRAALEREKVEFQQELSAQARQEVIAIADRLLRDLADVDLQSRIILKFMSLVQQLDASERDRLRSSARNGSSPTSTVRSAFELPADRREALQEAVRDLLGADVALEFETKPSLGCGIELSVDGQKIAWSIEDYLRSLDRCMRELIASQTRKTDGKSEATAATGQ